MEIKNLDINLILPYKNNPRKISDTAIEKVANSIKNFGFRQPIVVDKNNIVVVGHTRLQASRKLGLQQVPVLVADNLSEDQINAYRLADNRTNEESQWQNDLLKLELQDLQFKNFDLNLTAFDDFELDDLLFEEKYGLTDDDAAPEVPKEAKTQYGQVFKLGQHKLICGDSSKIEDLQKIMTNELADMVFTDPPYGIDYSGGRTQVVANKEYGKIMNDTLQGDELGGLIANMFKFVKNEADYYICVSPLEQKPFLDILKKQNKKLDAVIVWDKKNPGLGYMMYRRQCEFILYVKGKPFKMGDTSDFDLWRISKDNTQKYLHGTQKPVQLSTRAIKNSSKENDLVLDVFGGSGSTMIACEKTNRKCYTIELDPAFCDVIIKRWEDYTGKKAELIS